MKRSKRILAALSAGILALSSLALNIGAADAQAVEVDGVMTSFVSSFGKVSYGGKSRVSFKTLDEGIAAVNNGGKVVFTGTGTLSSDTLGTGGPVIIEGIGTKVTGNCIVPASGVINAANDLTFSNVSFKFPAEGSGFLMNGHNFTTEGEIDTFHTVSYPSGEKKYSSLMNLFSGDATEDYKYILTSGTFATVALSSGNVSANSEMVITGGSYEKLVVGSLDGKNDGDMKVTIAGGDVAELIIGAENGAMNGNITVDITGGNIGSIKTGAYGENASFTGSATITISGAAVDKIDDSGNGKTDASVIYVSNTISDLEISENAKYNSILSIKGGSIIPVFDGGKLSGIKAYDDFDCEAEKLSSESGDLLPVNGIFALPEGKYSGKVVSSLNLGINDNANYVAGYEDGTFLPQNNMTRAEAITLLTRIIADEKTVKSGNFENNFADVDANAWYAKYIGFFDKAGLLNKIGDGENIEPSKAITRAEFVQLIYNIERLLDEDGITYAEFSKLVYNVSANIENAKKYKEFSDVDYTNKYSNAIYHAVVNGYVNGYSDGTFAPDGNITRAEVVTVVNRMLGRKPSGTAGAVFSDISGHWASSQIVAAAGTHGTDWTRSADLGAAADGTAIPEYVKLLMNEKKPTALAKAIATHIYKMGTEATVAKDITDEQKTALKAAIDELKTEARNKNTSVINGSPDDLKTYIYSHSIGPYVREVVIESKKPDTDPVEIVQTSDTHFNLVNALDEEEKNPSVMSTKIGRTWLANGVSVTPVARAMEYARYSDVTIVTGDVLDYLSHGCKELTIENLFRVDTDIMASLGNHDTTRVMQGTVADPTSYESRFELIEEFWIHDALYESRVIKDKVMCVVVDNGTSKFVEEQVEKLRADIEKARENDYVILVFFHIPISTRNPEDTEVPTITGDGDKINYYTKLGNNSGPTKDFCDLLVSNGDIVKGVFNGHEHGDYYTEVLATYKDENGNIVDTVIPQYTLTSTVYGNVGHVIKITVK